LLGELQSGSNNSLYTESLHSTLCLHLLRHYTTSQTEINYSDDALPPYLHRRLDEYIQANLSQNITLSDMAQVTSLSTSHLTKLFKQSQGISLYQYVIHCRIARAKQLLKHQQLTIAEIATQVGFADQSHLTHHFKRHVGVTPKVFRQL
jgi:AraC family transcriptional regulator